jgi:hypothetical protein
MAGQLDHHVAGLQAGTLGRGAGGHTAYMGTTTRGIGDAQAQAWASLRPVRFGKPDRSI